MEQMDYRLPGKYNERYTSKPIPSGCPTNGDGVIPGDDALAAIKQIEGCRQQ